MFANELGHFIWFVYIHREFLPRSMECRRGLAVKILSVCPSVRLSHAWIVKKNGRKICPDL